MSDLIYRFRSSDRLLGKDGKSGELEKLEIFFAEPSQLNDPLEGYKDIFWAGDYIAWLNLFKHYTICLVRHLFLHLVTISDDEAPEPAITIRGHCDSLPEGVAILVEAAHGRFLKFEDVKSYIEGIADFRKIRLEELIFHFQVLHRVALHSILTEFELRGLLPFQPEDIIENLEKHLLTCKETSLAFSQGTVTAFDDSVYEKAYGFMLGAKIEHMQDKRQRSWFYLMAEFPEAFCKSLEDLVHPSWYTACFMDDCTNSSVWGSYGDNHKGLCLVYKAQTSPSGKPSLRLKVPVGEGGEGLIKDFVALELHKVDYERKFAQIDFFNALGSLPISILNKYWYTDVHGGRSKCGVDVGTDEWRQNYWNSVIHTNTTKLKDWEFEREYRAILLPSILDLSDADARACSYDFNSLFGIIFGIKTPIHEKIRTIEIVRSLCSSHGRKEFVFYQARYNPTTNKISHHEINVKV